VTKETRLRALHDQIQHLQRRLERLNRISYRYSWIRAAVVFAGLLASGLAFYFVGAWLFGLCLFRPL
jgi:fatty acid desaturase